MKYYVFNLNYNYCQELNGLDELIYYFSKETQEEWWNKNKKYNRLLDDLAMNQNDKKAFRFDEKLEYTSRSIIVMDENERIIDVRDYEYEILNKIYDKSKISFLNKRKKKEYTFRQDPVPNISNKWYRHKGFRRINVRNEIKQSLDREVKEFTRPSRISSLLSFKGFNYKCRHLEKSWKKQKIKHQWMKNFK